MVKKLSDIYLFSDVDGTLHSAKTGIPPRNLEAIQRFVSKGGNFGLATGRSAVTAQIFFDQLPINAPCLCVNGGGVYDVQKGKYLYTKFLPPEAREYAQMFLERYPEIDMAVVADTGYYYVADPTKAIRRMKMRHMTDNPLFEREIEGNWFKLLFNTKDEDCKRILGEMEALHLPGVTFTTSDTYFIEMMPEGTSKGAAILAICDILGLEVDQTVAVGDYYNDLEMLRTAGHSACVAGAPDDIKEIVDEVLCSCEDGALADLIERLESRYE